MPTKRSPSSFETDTDAKPDLSTPPQTPSKKSKKAPGGTPKVKASPNSGGWDNEAKAALVRRLVETGYKNMDWGALASETGMTESQCKNQLTPGRNNIRKVLSETFS
ncbi:hypothetical protein M231_06552 [Tremella mesenterica]|uniref:Myb-like domain-containing protein n=1 Tax=Tremella mesenterica TaxID=5217 RepID=A0A4Q1BBL0_TREME|nr:uncharacterized protein TREMEDRAFT_58821 [Tremella mesenterica DSM 1558]EIW72652.1 hypothetical protein TREMEDRAFT_58821 [Tremella mesenterica DSM 1558]RXK36208.1 hypothetical protein M231_06552 [Tremella mesenterica]